MRIGAWGRISESIILWLASYHPPSSFSLLFARLSEVLLKALRISKECLHWVDLGLSKGLHGPSGRKGQVLEADVHPQPDI